MCACVPVCNYIYRYKNYMALHAWLWLIAIEEKRALPAKACKNLIKLTLLNSTWFCHCVWWKCVLFLLESASKWIVQSARFCLLSIMV